MKDKILEKQYGMLTYGITPPKAHHSHEKIQEIAARQIKRIQQLDVDALVIYDIQDESDRTDEKRVFDFIETVDPSLYANMYLKALEMPKIVYRCVGNYDKSEFVQWLNSGDDQYSVFVGTASKNQSITLSLGEAYEKAHAANKSPLLGGVVIPERHFERRDEPKRLARKVEQGCEYFISQCVYDASISKAFLRDYKKYFEENHLEIKPIIFTLTPCGSLKTLEFIKWLGIRVPRWVEEDLLGVEDMLAQSLNLIEAFYAELSGYAKQLGIPVGCNVESVSIRKVEIEASIKLAKDIRAYMQRKQM